MPGYDRKFDEDGTSYTVVPDEDAQPHESASRSSAPPLSPTPYSYASQTPNTYSYESQTPSTYSYESQVPSAPAASSQAPRSYDNAQAPRPGYATPPPLTAYSTPPSSTSSAPTTGPTDDEIDALLAANGGRLSSKAMRQLEMKVRAREGTLPKLPSGPVPSETDRKRSQVMSKIPRTKTKDSEGGDLGFVTQDGGGLSGKKLVSHYEGESTSKAWRAGSRENAATRWKMDPDSPEFEQRWQAFRSNDNVTTHYDPQDWSSKQRSQLKEKGGGKVKATHQQREYSNVDEHGWVMDPSTGAIHTFDPLLVHQKDFGHKKAHTHHSSPLAGGAVAGAGMMKIEDKHITQVTDESGHYRPEGEYTYQAVNAMAKRGLLDRKAKRDDRDTHQSGPGTLSAKVTLGGATGRDGRPGKGWLNDEEGIYKDDLTLPYQAFLQTKGNERQARAKKSMQDELLSKVTTVEDGPAPSFGKKGASSLPAPNPSPVSQLDPDAPQVYEEYDEDAPQVYEEYKDDDAPQVYEEYDEDDEAPEFESTAGYWVTGDDGELKRIS